jgi:hypothetical protein
MVINAKFFLKIIYCDINEQSNVNTLYWKEFTAVLTLQSNVKYN